MSFYLLKFWYIINIKLRRKKKTINNDVKVKLFTLVCSQYKMKKQTIILLLI